jgi:hypothetical protein
MHKKMDQNIQLNSTRFKLHSHEFIALAHRSAICFIDRASSCLHVGMGVISFILPANVRSTAPDKQKYASFLLTK